MTTDYLAIKENLEAMDKEIGELRDALADEERVVDLSAAIIEALRYRIEKLRIRCAAITERARHE